MANGIPALLGKVANVANTVSLVVADAKIILGMFAPPKWGLYDKTGALALHPDSIVSLDFKSEFRIPNYPVEQGAFESYNKVALPRNFRIRMTKGGSDIDRYGFLVMVTVVANSLSLYSVQMPEGTMPGKFNVEHYSFTRTATNGVGLLTVDMDLVEVMVSATAAFSNTAQPSGADPTNTGTVQSQAPTSAQTSAASQSQ